MEWEHTTSEKNNMAKPQVTKSKIFGEGEFGVDELRDKETVTQVLDRLLGELTTTAVLVDDLRSKAFAEGEAKCDTKEPSTISLESQAYRAASKAESINRNLKSIISRL